MKIIAHAVKLRVDLGKYACYTSVFILSSFSALGIRAAVISFE
jgi:hypothetical protein